MIAIKSVNVNTLDLKSLTFSWEYEVQPPGVDLGTTTVDIQRSESDDFSEYTTIAAGLNANNYTSYTDTLLSGVVTNRYKDINYRARFVELGGYETISDVAWLTTDVSLSAKEIIRRKNLILNRRGLSCYYLKKKNFGVKCTECFDEIMEMQITGNCLTCYNTRFEGGFYQPINIKAFMTQTPDINMINRFGEINPGQMMFSIAAYPNLAVNDVIVDHLNRRWYVTRINNVSLRGHIISQDAVLSLIDHNDVIYEYEIS